MVIGKLGLLSTSCRAEALENPDRCLGRTFAVKAEMISAVELAEIISKVTGQNVFFHFMSDEEARSLPFPGAIAFANMFQFIRESSEAHREMAKLPSLGQSESACIYIERHRDEFSRVLARAQRV